MPQKIVLGCTHYPYLLDILSEFAPKDIFINPAQKFAQLITDDMKKTNLLSDGKESRQNFYVSKNPEQFVETAKIFYDIKQLPTLKIL